MLQGFRVWGFEVFFESQEEQWLMYPISILGTGSFATKRPVPYLVDMQKRMARTYRHRLYNRTSGRRS